MEISLLLLILFGSMYLQLTTKPYLNTYLTQRLFSLILSEYGYDYVFFRRLYEITEELKYDKELLEVINKAISFKNKLTNNK